MSLFLWLLSIVCWAETVTLSTPYMDEFTVQINGQGDSAVLLIHGDQEDAANMQGYAKLFASPKLRTVTFDLPGSGSRADVMPMHPFMHLEVRTVMAYLRELGVKDIQCVGSGFGAILCMQAATTTMPLSQLAIISPVHTKYHQSLFSNLDAYPKNARILVLSGQNTDADHTIARLEDKLTVELYLVEGYMTGTKLMVSYPALEKPLREWVWKQMPHHKRPPVVNVEHKLTVEGEPLPF